MKLIQKLFSYIVLGWFCASLITEAVALEAVGKVSLLKGVVSAQDKDQSLRTLAKGSQIFLSDQLETSEDSFLVIKMNDGGKVTLRPQTVFQVVKYNQKNGQEEERFKLLKGGFRAISGAIGHARPENVKMETRTTTIGIRGTDVVVHDCLGRECDLIEKKLGDKSRIPPGRKGEEGNPLPILTILDGDTRRILEREEVADIKDAVYFAVLDGKIYAQSGDERIDLDAIDACYRAGETPFDPDQEFHCLIEVPKFVLYDAYLNGTKDEFTLFNAFKDLGEDAQMCEVNW